MLAHGRRLRRALWALGVVLAAYCLFVYFAVPPLVKAQLESRLSALTGRAVAVGEVHASPFAVSLTVKRFDLRERDGAQSLFAFDELYVNIGLATLWRLAPVVDELRLAGPRLRLVRNEDRSYNVQDLMDAAGAPSQGESRPLGFSLNNIQVSGGRVDFDDRPAGKHHSVTDLHIGLPFLSTLSYATDIKVQPFLAGKLNDSPFGLRGETTPFVDGSDTVLRIDLDRVPLPRYLDYLPARLPLRVPEAELSANLVVNFTLRGGRPERIAVRGDARLRKLVLQHAGGAPLAQVEEIAVGLDSLDLVSRRAEVRDIRVAGPQVWLRRGRGGALDLPELDAGGGAAPATREARPAAASEPPWQVQVGRFQISSGAVELRDETPARPVRLRLQDIALNARELANAPESTASVTLAANDGAGAKLAYKGSLQVTPLNSSGKAEVTGLALRAFQPYVEGIAALELRDGVLDTAAKIDVVQAQGGAIEVRLSEANAALRALKLHHAGETEAFLRWAQLQVRGAELDLPARRIGAAEIGLGDAALRLRREPDGALFLPRMAGTEAAGQATREARQEAESTAAGARGAPPATGAHWQYLFERVRLERTSVQFEDRALRTPATQELSQFSLEAQKIGNAPGSRGSLAVRTQVNGTGRLSLQGEVGLAPPGARLRLEATSLPLAAVDTYVAEHAAVRITSGGLSAQGDLEVDLPEGAEPVVKYRGAAAVAEFAAQERDSGTELQQWKSLRLSGLAVDSSVPSLSLDELALAGFYSRVLIHADGQTNLQKLMRERKPAAKPVPKGADAAPRPAPQLRIGRITLQGGTVDYTDLFITPNVSARLLGVTGAIGEMNAQKAGEVELRASVDGGAPVEALGRVNPFGKELELDLEANARGVDLVPLTPYAAKYAGYGIEKGKLTLNLKYRVQQRRLAAENHVLLDQFTFGAPVESPQATKLPVQLAVSLLKDANGVIDINLPISGSLDDPQFSVGGLVLQALVNLVGKALTSPFALLGAMAGGGEELSYVEFAPGDARLDAEDVRKLETLAKALRNRPELRLEIAGRADTAADSEGLRRAGVQRQVLEQRRRAQQGDPQRSSAQGGGAPQDGGKAALSAEEYAKYLPAAYAEAKIPDKPRNFIGIAKDIPAAEMEALMMAAVPVGEAEMKRLAAARDARLAARRGQGAGRARLPGCAARRRRRPEGRRRGDARRILARALNRAAR
jgi:hypothetical protein